MNIEYLNTLPEVPNKFNFELGEGEKAVFNAKFDIFGNEHDQSLGGKKIMLTLTNKRIFVCNGPGIWTNDIEEIAACEYVKSRFLFMSTNYVSLSLNCESEYHEYDGTKRMLTGFHYYMKKSDAMKFVEIINQVLK